MGREEVRSVQLGISTIINGKWIASRKLGEGGCGVIYEVAKLSAPHKRYACKAELMPDSRDDEILRLEAKVIREMNKAGAKHAGICEEEGKFANFNYLIMTLLGPSIGDLRKVAPDQRFSTFTCVAVALQCLDGLKELHDVGYLHRDIKPSNLAIGEMGTRKEKLIYLLDFGLSRCYIKMVDGKRTLRDPRKTAPFRGTARYCSVNTHAREEQGRHDDLWSLIYMMAEMYTGDLPWRNMDRESTERCKVSSEKELLLQCPKELEIAVNHIKNLTYSCTPKYDLLRALFCQIYHTKCKGERRLDWEAGGPIESVRKTLKLPSIRDRDDATVSIMDLLKIPASQPEIKLEELGSAEKVSVQTISSYDDTIEDSQKKTSTPKPGLYGMKKQTASEIYHYKAGSMKGKKSKSIVMSAKADVKVSDQK